MVIKKLRYFAAHVPLGCYAAHVELRNISTLGQSYIRALLKKDKAVNKDEQLFSNMKTFYCIPF